MTNRDHCIECPTKQGRSDECEFCKGVRADAARKAIDYARQPVGRTTDFKT